MGIADILGFGKKEKKPFRTPREVYDLRPRIGKEEKENYPNLAHFKILTRDAEGVYGILNAIIAEKEYAEEAISVRDDIKKRMDRLAIKIKINIEKSKKDRPPDYVEKKIDYLERKSIRNNAKTLFVELLEELDLFMKICKEGRGERRGTLDSATEQIIKTVSELHDNFIKVYDDKEIQGLKEKALIKISDLNRYCEENKTCFEEHGLQADVEPNIKKLLEAARELSGEKLLIP